MARTSSPQNNTDPGTFALDQISGLVDRLRAGADLAVPDLDSTEAQVSENRLVIVRLGLATALFYALRVKHPPSASHSLRVALDCSLWAAAREMAPEDRDRFEVAALLHDIGKIGIPDRILKKQSALTVEERLTVDLQAALGCEILRGCCSDEILLETVRRFHDRYLDRRQNETGTESSVPLTARMLAIAEAFDAMTSFQPHRKTLSMEEGLAELRRCAGSQFDPELVEEYEALVRAGRERLRKATARDWLEDLNRDEQQGYWSRIVHNHHPEFATVAAPDPLLLYAQVVKRASDGVMLLDPEGTVISFNDQLQRFTGGRESEVLGRAFESEMLGLIDSDGRPLRGDACPIRRCLATDQTLDAPVWLSGKGDQRFDIHIDSILNAASVRAGLIVMIRERQRSAAQPIQRQGMASNHDGAASMLDFDAACERVVAEHRPYTLFLFVGETTDAASDAMRHQFSELANSVLRRVCRQNDVIFCPTPGECGVIVFDGAAGEIPVWSDKYRGALRTVTLPMIVTHAAVAATHDSDLEMTLNQARQLAGQQSVEEGDRTSDEDVNATRQPFWKSWFGTIDTTDTKESIKGKLQTRVPLELAVQKLEGFVADHYAVIKSQKTNFVALQLSVSQSDGGRRQADRQTTFHVEIRLSVGEQPRPVRQGEQSTRPSSMTILDVSVRPSRARDRRDRHWQTAALGVIDTGCRFVPQ